MTDIQAEPTPPPTAAQLEAVAKQRFIAMSILRLAGAVLVLFGILIMNERFDFVSGEKAYKLGAILTVTGIAQTLLIPRILARAWRSPAA